MVSEVIGYAAAASRASASVTQYMTSGDSDVTIDPALDISHASADTELYKTAVSADWCQLIALSDVDQNVLCCVAG